MPTRSCQPTSIPPTTISKLQSTLHLNLTLDIVTTTREVMETIPLHHPTEATTTSSNIRDPHTHPIHHTLLPTHINPQPTHQHHLHTLGILNHLNRIIRHTTHISNNQSLTQSSMILDFLQHHHHHHILLQLHLQVILKPTTNQLVSILLTLTQFLPWNHRSQLGKVSNLK